jgi:transposase InsO family protein
MSREVHVRFCEGLGVQFPRSTHRYIPMRKGFVYLAAVLDWATRRVLSWRLSNTLTPDFCLEAVEDALGRYGTPEIFNTDQGSQFTSSDFVDLLRTHGIQPPGVRIVVASNFPSE